MKQMKQIEQNDHVNRPAHYTDGKIEVIDFIEEKGLNFHRGNIDKLFAERLKENAIEFTFCQKIVPIQDIDETLKEFIND